MSEKVTQNSDSELEKSFQRSQPESTEKLRQEFLRAGIPAPVVEFIMIGTKVFPCNPADKAPYTKHGFHEATNETKLIIQWAQKYRNCLWAAPCGKDNGFDVLDFDLHKPGGNDTFEELTKKNGRLHGLLAVKTGNGGLHMYVKHDPALYRKPNVLKGFDYLGQRGYVVLPGSVLANGGTYEILE